MRGIEKGEATAGNEPRPWHALRTERVAAALATTEQGLESRDAEERLAVCGANNLPTAKSRGPLERLLSQLDNPLIYVLIASAAVTAALGHATDTAVILGVVAINALIGLIQEGRAEKSMQAIRNLIVARATVIRDGRRTSIDAPRLVPGDLLILEPGDRVTADARILSSRNLQVDESILTGESVPATKEHHEVPARTPLAERTSMVFSGTFITAGRATAIVVATGVNTELGLITSLLSRVEPMTTPLLKKMAVFARQITAAILGLSAVVFAVAVLVRGYTPADAFMTVVGMAVAAIPEGLPAVMSIALAVGVQRMAARNAVIRRLPAVETLGSITVICSDKTGTLTKNQMTVRNVATSAGQFEISGVGYAPEGTVTYEGEPIDPSSNTGLVELGRATALCNDAHLVRRGDDWLVEGDPMEGALLSLACKLGVDTQSQRKTNKRCHEIPFDTRHQYMATLHALRDSGSMLYVKGAPERILRMCATQFADGGDTAIDTAHWSNVIESYAAEGQRVLGIARKFLPSCEAPALSAADAEDGLELLGLVAIIDPPREEAITALSNSRRAGIRTIMITGDHATTASAIAAQLGLQNPACVARGTDVDGASAGRLRAILRGTNVFARTSPENKLRLVEALQADGNIVAMTGDGVNDAPALKRAEVGIAMGRRGTEAAKESSDVVLADDNFATIVAAVSEGRNAYDNIAKVIRWTLPTNAGETLAILAAIFIGLPLPITPVQILWVNMITAVGLGLIMAFDQADADVMSRPPRAVDEPILTRELIWQTIFVSVLFAAGVFAVFAWAGERGLSQDTARTMAVNTIVAMEIAYLFNVRGLGDGSQPLQRFLAAPALLIGVSSVIALQIAFTYAPPLQKLFATTALSMQDSVGIIAAGVFLFVIVEIERRIRLRSRK